MLSSCCELLLSDSCDEPSMLLVFSFEATSELLPSEFTSVLVFSLEVSLSTLG